MEKSKHTAIPVNLDVKAQLDELREMMGRPAGVVLSYNKMFTQLMDVMKTEASKRNG